MQRIIKLREVTAMTVVDRLLRYSWGISVLGVLASGLALLLGFEEPVQALLAIGTTMILWPLMLVVAHLMWTGALTPAEKRLWLRELVSWQASRALASYLQRTDRRTALHELESNRLAARS